MAGNFIYMFERIKNNAILTFLDRLKSYEMSTSPGFVSLSCLILSVIILFCPVIVKAEILTPTRVPAKVPVISDNASSCQIPFTEVGKQDLDPFYWMIKLYKRYLSPINSQRCPMYPSCSTFAAQALRDHRGKGLIMAFDRLLRCGRDLEEYTLIFKRGRVLRYDPVIQGFE